MFAFFCFKYIQILLSLRLFRQKYVLLFPFLKYFMIFFLFCLLFKSRYFYYYYYFLAKLMCKCTLLNKGYNIFIISNNSINNRNNFLKKMLLHFFFFSDGVFTLYIYIKNIYFIFYIFCNPICKIYKYRFLYSFCIMQIGIKINAWLFHSISINKKLKFLFFVF